MSMKTDMMLYLNMNDRLLGLNLREFIERHSTRPEFEVVSDFPNRRRRPGTNFRYRELGKDSMAVFNSKLYVMTKNHRQGGRFDLNVYSFDPTTDRKSIRLCDKSAAPRLRDGNHPIVFIHEEKFYALANPSYSSHLSYRGLGEEPQLFWVFDPFHECWKQLPHPLFDDNTYVNYEISYDHKIFIHTFEQKYRFDAHQERWELRKDSDQQRRYYEKPNFSAIVEFDDGFLIAVTDQTNTAHNKTLELVAYKLDLNGIPQRHQALHEVHGMFPSRPLISNPRVVLGKCDDNLMWLVYCGKDNVQDFSCIGVAVFRVFMSYDNAGDVVFSVDIEAADFIDPNSYEVQDAEETTTLVYSASAMCHDNLKTKDWFLYMDIGDRVCRLNISEFCKKRSSAFMSNFGVVHDLYPEGRPSTIPSRMRHIFVGSKVYLVGGQRLDRRIHCDVHGRCFAMPNLDIYSLNYTEEGLSITLCQCEGSIPRLIDPRTKTIPTTITVDDKIYVQIALF